MTYNNSYFTISNAIFHHVCKPRRVCVISVSRVVEATIRTPKNSRRLSPRSRTVYCSGNTITPVFRRILSASCGLDQHYTTVYV